MRQCVYVSQYKEKKGEEKSKERFWFAGLDDIFCDVI